MTKKRLSLVLIVFGLLAGLAVPPSGQPTVSAPSVLAGDEPGGGGGGTGGGGVGTA